MRPPAWAVAAVLVVLGAAGTVLWLRPVTLTVPPGATRTAILPDGSTVELNSGTTLSYRRTFGWRTRTVHLNGEAFFAVTPEAGKPFVVATFNAAVMVPGTRFNVRAWPDDPVRETKVVLEEGQVRLAAARAPAQAVMLAPGQMSRVVDGRATPDVPVSVSTSRMLLWRQGGFAFDDQPMGIILAEVARRYGIRIDAPEAVKERPLSLFLNRPEPVDTLLAVLCSPYGYHLRTTEYGYEILETTTD